MLLLRRILLCASLLLVLSQPVLAAGDIEDCNLKWSGESGLAIGSKTKTAVIQGDRAIITEHLSIRGGASQYNTEAPTQKLAGAYLKNFSHSATRNGDQTSIEFYPQLLPSETGVVAFGSSLSKTSSHGVMPAPAPVPAAVPTQPEEIAKAYVHFAHPGLSKESFELVVRTVIENPELLKIAKRIVTENRVSVNVSAGAVKVQSDRIVLSNRGEQRYFTFVPDQKHERVPARILAISEVISRQGSYFNFFIEYLETKDAGAAVRIMQELTLSELATLRAEDRDTVRIAFEDVLSPSEQATRRVANDLELPLFSLSTEIHRGRDSGSGARALVWLNNLTWLAIYSSVADRWWQVRDLYLPGESESNNIIDIFSRLNPNFVLREFRDPSFEYMWVITEDGQLKVSPKMPRGNNLKPQLARMSAGRALYAGGNLVFNSDGTVRVTYYSNLYQGAGTAQFVGMDAFSGSNQSMLDPFVAQVFLLQGKVTVSNFLTGADDFASRISDPELRAYFEEQLASARKFGFDSQDFQQKVKDEFKKHEQKRSEKTRSRKKQTEARAQAVATDIKWNPEKAELPLSLEEFAQKLGESSQAIGLSTVWGRYVLGVNENTSVKDIKSAYRKLSMMFHPDRNSQHPNAEETFKIISEAYSVLLPK